MNKIFLLSLLALGAAFAVPEAHALPDPRNAEFRMNNGPASGGPGVMLGYQVVSSRVSLLKCVLNVAVSGGSSTTAIKLRAVDGSICDLPKNSIVVDSLIDVITTPVTSGATTIAFGAGASTSSIKTATAKASYTGLLAGVPVGTAATSFKLAARSDVIATVSGQALSTGKINVFLYYLLGD